MSEGIERVDRAVDILILSNGPGELATWVKPVVQKMRQQLGEDRNQVRISVVLSPCANASGQEVAIAQRYPEIDRVQAATHFFPFLLFGKTFDNWDWRQKGVVLFLGGDQFFPVVIGKRLGYRTVIYAEWEARWHSWIDRFGVMRPEIVARVSQQNVHKFTVVGDLMAEVKADEQEHREPKESETGENSEFKIQNPLIVLLPGSKPAKLALGVPLWLAIAEQIYQVRPDARFVIAVAPTLELSDLAKFANAQANPNIQRWGWAQAELIDVSPAAQNKPVLKTRSGLCVELWTQFPAYDLLSQCDICLTTVGANTAELGALAVPMLVLLPTQQLDVMRAWDGIPGLLANLPGVGSSIAKVINWWALRRLGLLAWPNIWAKAEIVPELVGHLQPEQVAQIALDYLEHPEKLDAMRSRLRAVRGELGAATKLTQIVCEELQR